MRSNTSSPIMMNQQKIDVNKKNSKIANKIQNSDNNNNNSSVTSSSCSRSPSPASSISTNNLNINDHHSLINQRQAFQINNNALLFGQNNQINKGAFHQPLKQQQQQYQQQQQQQILLQSNKFQLQKSVFLPPPPPSPPIPAQQQQQQPQPTLSNSQHMPASFGAKQLNKLKRFLTTLQQFAADISPETGDRVRNLILSLIVSYFEINAFFRLNLFFQNNGISIEDFHSRLQESTNFPLRPFVIPFLKVINLKMFKKIYLRIFF